MKRVIIIVCLLCFLCVSASADQADDLIATLSDSDRAAVTSALFFANLTHRDGDPYNVNIRFKDRTVDLVLSQEEFDKLSAWQKGEYNHDDEDVPSETETLIGAELCNYKLLTITVDKAEIKESKWSGETELILSITIDNGNDFAYEGNVHFAAINGWQVHPICYFSINGGLKEKEEIVLEITDIGVLKPEDIETMSISFRLNYAYYSEVSDVVTLNFQ